MGIPCHCRNRRCRSCFRISAAKDDYIIQKHCYSGFFKRIYNCCFTSLGIKNLILTGLYTNICVRHTAADAFCWGYQIYIPRDCVCAFTPEEYEGDIAYLKTFMELRYCLLTKLNKRNEK